MKVRFVLCFGSAKVKKLREMRKFCLRTDKTFYWLNGLKQDIYFTETLSFLLALIEANVAYELLPIQMNCQLNMPLLDFQRNGYIDTLMYDEVPIVVHYPLETIPFNPKTRKFNS